MQLSNAVYDKAKWVAQIGLPALGALYFGLAAIWSLPAAEQVVGTVTVIDTFLGVLLGISTKSYDNSPDGRLLVNEVDGEKYFALGVDPGVTPEQLAAKGTVRLQVDTSGR